MTAKLVAVKCKLFPGVFPSERYFEVALADGTKHTGISPRHFCWNSKGAVIQEKDATIDVDGFIAAKLRSILSADYFSVEVPDGEVLAVAKDLVTERPTRIDPPGTSINQELELSRICT